MRTSKIEDIIVPANRQRVEFESVALQELADSISRLGLLQPIVVRKTNESQFTLVAGERRLRAVIDLHSLGSAVRFGGGVVEAGHVPTVDLGDLPAIEAFEAELEENIRRLDLTWQEQATALAQLHRLRGLQRPEHSITALAEEVVGSKEFNDNDRNNVKKQLVVARYLNDPDVAGAKTFRDAFKIIEAKELAGKHALHAAMVGETFGKHMHQVFQGDCLEVMATLDSAQFDCICTDPPYGMGADTFGDAAGKLLTIDHQYSDSKDSFRVLMDVAAPLMGRLCKPAAHMYICCDIDQFPWLKSLFSAYGWSVFRTPLINNKAGGGRVPLPEHGPRRSYETILYAYRGGRKVTGIYSDVIYTTGDENLGHGAQKPVELFRDLLKRSVSSGDRVLDPFAGTGTIFPAAHALQCIATGIEKEATYYGIAVKRIEELE